MRDAQRQEGEPQSPATLRSARAWIVLLVTIALGLAFDLITKSIAFERVADVPVATRRADVIAAGPGKLWMLIPPHDPVVVVPKVLNFTLVYNPGAVFGIGAGKRWFFVVFTSLAIVFGLWMFAKWTHAREHVSHVGIGLILAGGLGNLYDRLMFACVRDFIHPVPGVTYPFGWAPFGQREIWPWVSNVADALLIVGVGMLIIMSFVKERRAKREAASTAA